MSHQKYAQCGMGILGILHRAVGRAHTFQEGDSTSRDESRRALRYDIS
jgi:hypothetical protein